MTDSDDSTKLPPTGAFPGYNLGRNLFVTWSNALQHQANIWNANWTKLLDGTYEMKDWYSAIAQSLQGSSAAVEQMFSMISSPSTPPWASLKWPPTSEIEVRLRQSIDMNENLRVYPMSRLGGDEGKDPPIVEVKVTGANTVKLWLMSKDKQPANVTPGQYIGFVVSERFAEPLVIVTVSVPESREKPARRRT
jgi:hypothetical protein